MGNNDKIFSLVKNHFSLEDKSLKRFEELLSKPYVDEKYASYGLENLRKKTPILPSQRELFDSGWSFFKQYFNKFYISTGISYESFDEGIYQGAKLSKQLLKFYEKSLIDVSSLLTMLGVVKLPKIDNLSIVLSMDFADWFLCSTAESWKSCLSLNSTYQDIFWATLPGLVADKNRCMIYLTNGETKNYKGIETEKFIARTWGILDKNDTINTLKQYPIKALSDEILKFSFGKVQDILFNEKFISKHSIDFLYNKRGYSVFPYLDNSKLEKVENDYFIVRSASRGGMFGYTKNGEIHDGSPYNFEGSLDKLIEEEKELDDCCGEQFSCDACFIGLTEDEIYYDPFGNVLCVDCFYENFAYCEDCGKTIELKIDEFSFKGGFHHCVNCS